MFFHQTFDLSDIPRVFFLFLLEILLSADNAVVIGVLASHLRPELRKKALYIGTVSAFFFRAFALIFISYFIEYQWIQIFGALYLLYLALRYFLKGGEKLGTPTGGHSLWKTILLIELFDLAFAVDSILAGVAFIRTDQELLPSKIWIVYIGGMLGLIGIRYAAHLFSEFIHRFPRFKTSAHLMIGWIGLKLGYGSLPFPEIPLEPIFWTGMGIFLLTGFIRPKKGSA